MNINHEHTFLQVKLTPINTPSLAWIAHFQFGDKGDKHAGDYVSHTLVIPHEEAIICQQGNRGTSLREGSHEIYFLSDPPPLHPGPTTHPSFRGHRHPIELETLVNAIETHDYPTPQHKTLHLSVAAHLFANTPVVETHDIALSECDTKISH